MASNLRNIALLGHGGAGKTTLAEAMLHKAGAVNRQGRVQDGSTVGDFADDEKERQHSIDSSLLHCTWKDTDIQIVDTPGYPDFYGQALRALDAVDLAILVVHAFDGVALNTRRLFKAARERGLACLVVVNRCDAENVDADALSAQVQELCGDGAKLVSVPNEWGKDLQSVSIFGEGDEHKEDFVEAAVVADDDLMEKYLEEGEVSDEELRGVIPTALVSGSLIPIYHTAAEGGIGVEELLDFIVKYAPSPKGRELSDTAGNAVVTQADAPLRALCFKISFDRQAGKVAYLRVFGGSLSAGDNAVVARSGDKLRIGHVARVQGQHREEISQGGPGALVALTKVEEIELGDTLVGPGEEATLPLVPLPEPMVGLALVPKSRGDETKIGKELTRLADSDPCLVLERTKETNQLVLRGLSTLHVDVTLKRLAKAGVEVETSIPRVPYRETIQGKAEGHYRHKKQTGGAGQFGEVYLRIEPAERGSDDPLEYVTEIFGGSIPQQFLPAIEKGIRQKMAEGVIAGYPVVDIKCAVYDGKYHDVDSKEIAFIIAGRNAFALAVEKAKPVLLEPIVDVEVEVPSKFMGDITSDLNTRRARISGMDSAGDRQIIRAQAPLGEMQTYSTQLRSITAGEGTFTMEYSHYGAVPGNVQAQIVAKAKAAKEAESS